MTQFLLVGSGLTATTNPNPNTLSVVNPLPSGVYVYQGTKNTAWTGSKCLILPPEGTPYPNPARVWLRFVPSGGSGVAYTVTAWRLGFEGANPVWSLLASNGSNTYTGEVDDYYDNFDSTPVFFQLSNIASGTISIYADSQIVGAI